MKRGLFVVVLVTLLLVSAPAALADSGPGSVHVVRGGETLAIIAGRYCTTWQELYNLNTAIIVNSDQLYPGMTLVVVNRCGGDGHDDGGWPGNSGGHWGAVYDRGPRPHARGYVQGNCYAVVRGDTSYSIAQRFGISTNALGQANGIDPWHIHAGQSLTIPGLGYEGRPPLPPHQPYDGKSNLPRSGP